jgi:GNAT superfamily N-acetyltransferase
VGVTPAARLCGSLPLARRIEAAEVRLMGLLGGAAVTLRHHGAFVTPFGGGLAVSGGPSSPITKVIGVGYDGVPDAASLSTLEARYAAAGAEPVFEVATLADLSCVRALERRGYELQRTELVLGRAVRSLAESAPQGDPQAPPPLPDGVSIGEDHDLETWIGVSVDGFAASEAPEGREAAAEVHVREAIVQAAQLFTALPDAHRYLATRAGVPAGAASLRLDEGGIAQFSGATTLVEHRRRGIQTALLHHRLLVAADAGCDLAVVTTEPGSRSQANAERHGFTPLYSRLVLSRAAQS